jgi:hypothetical protein
MSIVSCPRCRDEVTVPAKAKPSAVVRCPLCREEYRLDEALEQLPPSLVVIDGGYDDDEGELVGAGVGASEYRVAGEYDGGGFSAGLGASDSVFSTGGPGGSALSDTAVAAPAPRLGDTSRPKRKQKSAVGELVKVVLGGVVGIVAAMMILWWAVGRDPLKLGPKVAEYAPWIVPEQFHGKGKVNPTAPTTADTSGASTIAANPNAPSPNTSNGFSPPGVDLEAAANSFNANEPGAPNAASGGGGFAPSNQELPNPLDAGLEPGNPLDGGLDADLAGLNIDQPLPAFGDKPEMPAEEMPAEGNDPLSALDNPPDLTPAADPLDSPEPETPAESADEPAAPPAPQPSAPPATDIADAAALPDPFAPTPPPATPPAEMPADEPAQPEEAPVVAAAQIDEAIGLVTAAREAFDNSKGQPAAERQKLAIEMYAQAAAAGPLLAGAPTENADYAETVEKVNAELLALGAPSRHNALNFLTTKRLDTPEEGEGVLLVGTVKDFKSVGSLYETTFELAGRDPRIVFVVTEANPQDQFKVGDMAAIVGRIVRDVKKQLPKYGGEQTVVVEQGHAVALPAQ